MKASTAAMSGRMNVCAVIGCMSIHAANSIPETGIRTRPINARGGWLAGGLLIICPSQRLLEASESHPAITITSGVIASPLVENKALFYKRC